MNNDVTLVGNVYLVLLMLCTAVNIILIQYIESMIHPIFPRYSAFLMHLIPGCALAGWFVYCTPRELIATMTCQDQSIMILGYLNVCLLLVAKAIAMIMLACTFIYKDAFEPEPMKTPLLSSGPEEEDALP